MTLRPYLRPLPLLGLSASTLVFASIINSTLTKSNITKMSTSSHAPSWPVKQYQPRHTTWPYKPSDFDRQDPSTDTDFYSSPRFVTHIDDAAIATLRSYYSTVLPTRGRILDFCSSWISHYPPEIERLAATTTSTPPNDPPSLQVIGLGLNQAELAANPILNGGRLVVDLNANPDIGAHLRSSGALGNSEAGKEDSSLLAAATNVVSTDYLTRPVEVLTSLRKVMAPGASVHLVISNRCFPTKAIGRWLRVGEEERLLMVGDFLHFAGWTRIEIVELSDGTVREEGAEEGETGARAAETGLRGLMRMMGMNSRDPLWVVRAVNEGAKE